MWLAWEEESYDSMKEKQSGLDSAGMFGSIIKVRGMGEVNSVLGFDEKESRFYVGSGTSQTPKMCRI